MWVVGKATKCMSCMSSEGCLRARAGASVPSCLAETSDLMALV